PVGDGGDGLGDVIEDDHAVEEAEREVGDAAIVWRGVGKAFDVADGVVAGVADGAAAEARQTGQVRGPVRRDHLFQHFERVGRVGVYPGTVTVLGANVRAAGLE